jgi:aspartate aminotransferase
MTRAAVSERAERLLNISFPVIQFLTDSRWARQVGDPDMCDFMLGNPHEMPLAGFSEALKKWSAPQNKDWFAYKMSETPSQEIVAATLRKSHGLPFNPEDIFMTNGAFAAISVATGAITDPGDEIIYISPPWFFYEPIIASYNARPVRVKCDPDTFDLDLDAIGQAISSRTRGIIINSPNNPTGRIYPRLTLEALASLLNTSSERNGRTIYLLSDESYHRIVYDDRAYLSPTAVYSNTFMLYTYGKTLLTPGQRMGFIALPPDMPAKEQIRPAITISQLVTGYAFPNALLQHALPDLEKLSIDVAHLQAKRDRMVTALSEMGYELRSPEGTFYLLVRSPLTDDMAFTDLLADQNVYCLPGTIFEMPGYFRISLTANDEMIDRGLPGFAAAIQQVRESLPAEK